MNIHFEISERKILLRVFDMALVLVMLIVVSNTFQLDYIKFSQENWFRTVLLIAYLLLFSTIFELYNLQKASHLGKTVQNITVVVSLTVLFFLFTPFFAPALPGNRLQILALFATIFLTLVCWRFLYIKLFSTQRFYKRVLVVGDSFDIHQIVDALEKSDPNYQIIGYINTSNDLDDLDLSSKLKEIKINDLEKTIADYAINEIVVSSAYTKGMMLPLYNKLIVLLEDGLPIRDYTQVYEEVTHRIPVQHIDKDFYKFFPFSRSNQNKFYLFYRRFFDIVISIIGIILSSLLMPFVLIGNFFGNRGVVFYKQQRVGRNGKIFTILKLRTMVEDAEKAGAQWAQKNDARATSFGKFLRKTRIDEIPQFYNILVGDMSIIGPRPERPIFVKELSEIVPFYATRHIIKPGLTGWAQVNTEYGSTHSDSLEKLQYDLYYIKHRGLFLDLSILLKTLSTILFYRGQ